MSDFFRILTGLELNGNIQLLEGAGVPTLLAPRGSLYLDNTAGDVYAQTGVGSNNIWEKLATKSYVDSQLGTQISWREPVVVRDDVSTTVPVGVAGNPITVDGVSITNTKRVLFSAISGGGGPNVYIYNQTTGLFAEDANNETAGDTLYVSSGTSGGQRYTYNGSIWVLTDLTTLDELQYIRDFIGKNAAGPLPGQAPSYSSITQISPQGVSLETAIGQLDAAIGTDPTTVPVSGTPIITNTNTINQNIQSLANFIQNNNAVTTALSVTTVITLDTITTPLTKWVVRCEQVGTLTNVEAVEIYATHNGVSVDYTVYAKLKLGTTITGLTYNVTLTGGTDLNLTIASTAAVNVKAKRVAAL